MAINPLQLPAYAAPQQADFSSLASLGKVYQQGQQDRARREAMSLANLGQGGEGFNKGIQSLAALGDLEGAGKLAAIQKSIAPETSADMQAYGLYRRQGGSASFLDFKKDLAQAGATRVNTTNNVSGGGGTDKQIYDSLEESAKAARTAATGLQSNTEARKALQGGMVTGLQANPELWLRKAAKVVTGVDDEKITNTETFRSAIAPQVAAMMKATVGSANISNSDREFAEKAAGGNISLDGASIARLLDIMDRAGREVVSLHQQRLDDIYPDQPDKKFRRERALFGVRGPAAAANPAPAAPSGWQPVPGMDGVTIRRK